MKGNTNIDLYKAQPILFQLFTRFSKGLDGLLISLSEEINYFQVNKIQIDYLGHLNLLDGNEKINTIADCILDNRTFFITVHDKRNIQQIIKTIEQKRKLACSLGDEKNIIKVSVPDPTEERRVQVIKEMKTCFENYTLKVNNLRRDFMNELDKERKSKTISEDEFKDAKTILSNLNDESLFKFNNLFQKRERDIKNRLV